MKSLRMVEVIGHAGAAGFFPHNSRDSLAKAIELGVDRIEVDILTALDDVLILSHDASLVYEGSLQETRNLRLDELQVILTGLLTLEDAIEMTGDRFPLLLDIKARHISGPLIAAIEATPAKHRLSACGVFARTLRQLRQTFPTMQVGLSRGHSLTRLRNRYLERIGGILLSAPQSFTLTLSAKWCGAREVMIYHQMCTRLMVFACHLAGLRVNVWTVDEPRDMRRVLASGADGIISNRPDLVMEVLTNRGYRRIGEAL